LSELQSSRLVRLAFAVRHFRTRPGGFAERFFLIAEPWGSDEECAEGPMKRARTSLTLLPALLVSAAEWAAPAAGQLSGAAPVAASGVSSVAFNVNIASTAPAGVTTTCKARIAPNLPAFENSTRGAVPAEPAPGVATVIGSSANCTGKIPFSWMVADTRNEVAPGQEIDAVSGGGVAAVRTGRGMGMACPATGGAARLRLNATF
jgi:hypothetical protein